MGPMAWLSPPKQYVFLNVSLTREKTNKAPASPVVMGRGCLTARLLFSARGKTPDAVCSRLLSKERGSNEECRRCSQSPCGAAGAGAGQRRAKAKRLHQCPLALGVLAPSREGFEAYAVRGVLSGLDRYWLQYLSTGLMKRMSKRSMLWSSNTAAKSAGALAAT